MKERICFPWDVHIPSLLMGLLNLMYKGYETTGGYIILYLIPFSTKCGIE